MLALAATAACGGAGVEPGDDGNGNGNGNNGGTPSVSVIVFDMVVNGNRDIYSVKSDGSALTRLTTDPAADVQPTMAKGRILFTSYRENGVGELYEMTSEGGNQRRIMQTPFREEMQVALAPDASRVAFSAALQTELGIASTKIFVGNYEAWGSEVAAPEFGFSGAIESSPSWAPDAKRLVFASTDKGTADLYILDLSTAGAPKVTLFQEGAGAEIEPTWSPDGSSIAFTSERNGNTDIYVAPVAGGAATRLTDGAGTAASPTFLADGRIAFLAWQGSTSRLRVVDPKAPAQIADITISQGSPRHPAGAR